MHKTIKDTASLLAGNLIYMLSQWLILVTITKYVGLSEAGIYSLSLAIVSPIFTLTNLGLRSVAATDVDVTSDVSDYFIMAAFGNTVALTASLAIATFMIEGESVNYYVLSALLLSKIVESFCFILYGLFQSKLEINHISRSMAIRGSLGFFVFLMLFFITDHYEIALFGMAATWLLTLLLFDIKNALKLGFMNLSLKINPKRMQSLKRLFLTAFPLGALACFTVTSQYVPRYFIAGSMPIEYLGVFAGIAHLALLGAAVVNAAGQSVLGQLARLYKADPRNFIVLHSKITFVAITIGIAGIVMAYTVGDWLLGFIYGSGFIQYKGILVYAMVWCGFMYVSGVIGTGLSGMRSFKLQGYIGGINLIAICVSSFVFIPEFGLAGAFYALTFTVILKLIFQYLAFIRAIRRRLSDAASP